MNDRRRNAQVRGLASGLTMRVCRAVRGNVPDQRDPGPTVGLCATCRARGRHRQRPRLAVLPLRAVEDRSARFPAIRRCRSSAVLAMMKDGMHTHPARATEAGRRARATSPTTAVTPRRRGDDRLIRGRALIFWDPKSARHRRRSSTRSTPIRSRPAADCVSESLETLDERWKAGSFRYLMPDFRARVHRGETFVIAGDRFAIGSSREMSPAGLKGVAEEVGPQLVVVCGHNMGDIFRRNAFNLGLHVVQSPEAVADAQDGDELHVRSRDAAARERDAGARPTSRCRCRRRKRRSAAAAASSRSAGASSAVGRDRAVDRLAAADAGAAA